MQPEEFRNYFLVGGEEAMADKAELELVRASFSEDAIEKYIRARLGDQMFLENVGTRTINMSFSEVFFIPDLDGGMWDGTPVSDEEAAARMDAYFAPHGEWAEIFKSYWFRPSRGDITYDEEAVAAFPREMLYFIGSRSWWTELVVHRLSDVQYRE